MATTNNDHKKTGFDVWYEKEYNNAQKEAMTFRQADLRKAYEAAYRVAFGLIEKGVEHAWKEGYVVGFNEGKTHTEVNDGNE
jgi:hypothetical protein